MIGNFQRRADAAALRAFVGHFRQVRAGAESAAFAGENQRAEVAGFLDVLHRIDHAVDHLHRCCVQHFGMVHREYGDVAVRRDVAAFEILAHGRPSICLGGA